MLLTRLRRRLASPAPVPVPPAVAPVDLSGLEARMEQLVADLAATRVELDAARHVATESRDMAARAYERLERGPELVAGMRAAADYAAAWDDAAPLISVVIATYDQSAILCERAIASVQSQTYPHWELVIVGDHCTDDTAARVAALGDDRIRFVNLPVRGPYPDDPIMRWRIAGTTPHNAASDLATGRWIAPLGHDDAFDADHLEVLLALAREERAELAYGQLRTLDAASGRELPNVVGRWPPQHTHIGMQGAIYHRGLTAFPWDVNARFAGEPNDWNFTRRLWEAGVRFAFLERPVTSYYYSPKDEAGQAWVRQVLATAEPRATTDQS